MGSQPIQYAVPKGRQFGVQREDRKLHLKPLENQCAMTSKHSRHITGTYRAFRAYFLQPVNVLSDVLGWEDSAENIAFSDNGVKHLRLYKGGLA